MEVCSCSRSIVTSFSSNLKNIELGYLENYSITYFQKKKVNPPVTSYQSEYFCKFLHISIPYRIYKNLVKDIPLSIHLSYVVFFHVCYYLLHLVVTTISKLHPLLSLSAISSTFRSSPLRLFSLLCFFLFFHHLYNSEKLVSMSQN